MLKSKIIFFIIMISLFSSKLNASYEKLAFDFSFKDLDGTELKQSEFRDKDLVLLDRAETEFDEEGEPAGVFGHHFIGWDTAIASDKNADFTGDFSYNFT